jgi:hypothetical protein
VVVADQVERGRGSDLRPDGLLLGVVVVRGVDDDVATLVRHHDPARARVLGDLARHPGGLGGHVRLLRGVGDDLPAGGIDVGAVLRLFGCPAALVHPVRVVTGAPVAGLVVAEHRIGDRGQ